MIRSLIVAASENDVIGRDGDLPWHIPGDLRRFRRVTRNHVTVMGRLTYESITARLGGPLPDRISVVVSSLTDAPPPLPGIHWQPSVPDALAVAETLAHFFGTSELFVIGGASVYAQTLPVIDRIYLTRVHAHVEGDSLMPPGWLDGFQLVSHLPGAAGEAVCPHTFQLYERRPHTPMSTHTSSTPAERRMPSPSSTEYDPAKKHRVKPASTTIRAQEGHGNVLTYKSAPARLTPSRAACATRDASA
jgi:dihydrofolate reductase